MAITVGRKGRAGKPGSKFDAYLEGGPELVAKLAELEKKVRNKYARAALEQGGIVIAAEWSVRAPIGIRPEDTHPGAYRESLQQGDTVKTSATKKGASGSVAPRVVAGLELNDQPLLYAAKLEFADGEPSARPAFDSSRDRAAQAVGDALKEAFK